MVTVEILEKPRIPQAASFQLVEVENSQPGLLSVDFVNQAIPAATLHVFSVKIDGKMHTDVVNTGKLPLFRSNVVTWRNTLENQFDLGDYPKMIGFFRRGANVGLDSGWTVTGPLNVLWDLIRILFTGSARVRQEVDFKAFGYRTKGGADLVVPVKSVSIAWD